MTTVTTLNGFNHIGELTITEQLQYNLMEYFNWGFLNKGGFFNINIPSSGAYGGHNHILRRVDDPNYTDGQVWETYRQDLVWESGIPYDYQPISISGVYVNNTFLPLDQPSPSSYSINYKLGRVTFDTPISTSAEVKMEYSHRWYQFTTQDAPWFKELMANSFRVDKPDFLSQQGSGIWSTLGMNRLQMPACVIEIFPSDDFEGIQLGGGQRLYQDVIFHVIAENPSDRNRMIDQIRYQNTKKFFLYDLNQMITNQDFPLDFDGSLNDNAKNYEQLVRTTGNGGYRYKDCRFEDMATRSIHSKEPLYWGAVKATISIEMYDL